MWGGSLLSAVRRPLLTRTCRTRGLDEGTDEPGSGCFASADALFAAVAASCSPLDFALRCVRMGGGLGPRWTDAHST
jgi:hypothetical protein